MFGDKISPELFVAIVLSAVILSIMGVLSYVSNNYTFLFAGLSSVILCIPVVFFKDKL